MVVVWVQRGKRTRYQILRSAIVYAAGHVVLRGWGAIVPGKEKALLAPRHTVHVASLTAALAFSGIQCLASAEEPWISQVYR